MDKVSRRQRVDMSLLFLNIKVRRLQLVSDSLDEVIALAHRTWTAPDCSFSFFYHQLCTIKKYLQNCKNNVVVLYALYIYIFCSEQHHIQHFYFPRLKEGTFGQEKI